jgi:hypothetical protein
MIISSQPQIIYAWFKAEICYAQASRMCFGKWRKTSYAKTMNSPWETSHQRTQITGRLQTGYTHQPRRSLIIVERDLPLRRALGDPIHKEGRTLEWDTCRRQAESWIPECEPSTVYKCATTLRGGAVTSSLILLEVPSYRQAYIVPKGSYIYSVHLWDLLLIPRW